MWNVLRKVGFSIVVLAISAGIYLTFFAKKEIKENVLEYSVNLFGDKLLAMVPDGPEKEKLTESYDQFREQAVRHEIPPQQVERVAADILNLSNSTDKLTPAQAEALLRVAFLPSGALAAPAIPSPRTNVARQDTSKKAAVEEAPQPVSPEQWKQLADRLRTMYTFNEDMRQIMKQHAEQQRELQAMIRYQVKDGLKLAIDDSLKAELNRKEFGDLRKQLKQLEKESMLVWSQNFSKEMEEEMARMRASLRVMQDSLAQLHQMKSLESLKALESLKSLEQLKYMHVVDADSIRRAVEKSLEEAGISPRKQQP